MRRSLFRGGGAFARGAAMAMAALGLAVPAGVSAQTVNMDQIKRILTGETIVEQTGVEPAFTEEFFFEDCRWAADGGNRFFSLRPGYQLVLEGIDEDEQAITLIVTVLEETRRIRVEFNGVRRVVRTRVVEEREFVDGELFEISRNFYARCTHTNDIVYFGEDVCFFEDGECVRTDGSWLAGVDGATPGIIMPGTFMLGARYFQEQAPGIALDRAEHAEMGMTVTTPAGTFENCVRIVESSVLDAGATGEKIFCPDVGFIKEGPLELVSFGFDDDDDDDDRRR